MSDPLSEQDRLRLVRLLGMLGSDHAGERDNAARLAEQIRRENGATWDDLLTGQIVYVDREVEVVVDREVVVEVDREVVKWLPRPRREWPETVVYGFVSIGYFFFILAIVYGCVIAQGIITATG